MLRLEKGRQKLYCKRNRVSARRSPEAELKNGAAGRTRTDNGEIPSGF